MKKITLLLAFIIFVISFAGCADASGEDRTTTYSNETDRHTVDVRQRADMPEDTDRAETGAPETTSSETTEPETEPDTTRPETTKPETTKPETTKPDTTKPDTTKPDTTKPDTTKPETTKPDTTKPETTEPETTKPETTTPTQAATDDGFCREVARLVNDIRRSYGLSELLYDEELSRVAALKSQDMCDLGYFSHQSPTYGSPFDMMKSFGITYRAAGENIARGYRTPESVVDGWMNSEGHRANILSAKFTKIGMGYVADGNYWTQMFIG